MKMKFGNYNLTTETEKQRHLFVFRIKKVKSTANYIVGKFHSKIGTIAMQQKRKKKRKQLVRSESPLSYRASLFENNTFTDEADEEKFGPDDFPKTCSANGNDKYYVFSKIHLFNKNKSISGKRKLFSKSIYPYQSFKSNLSKRSSIFGSIQSRKKDLTEEKSTIVKLLETNSDENTEMQILRDYFDTMSYTEIVKDKHFKNYLIKKEYLDIIDYVYNTSCSELSPSEASSLSSNNDCDSVKKEKLKADISKKYYSNTNSQVFCKRNRTFERYYQNYDSKKVPNYTTLPTKLSHKANKIPSYVTLPKNRCTQKYHQVRDFCEKSLSRYKAKPDNHGKLKKVTKKYSEKNYNKVISEFIKKRGFNSSEEYVEFYYGKFLKKKTYKYTKHNRFNSLPPPPYSSGNFRFDTNNNDAKFNSLLYDDSFKNYDYVQQNTLTNKRKKSSSNSFNFKDRPIFKSLDEDEDQDYRNNHVILDDLIVHNTQQYHEEDRGDTIYESIRSIQKPTIRSTCCSSTADTNLRGYRDEMLSEEMSSLVPPGLQGKADILFGNLHELYTFHSDIFLKDLENCISTTELVALCFVQRRDTFFRLYSYYCQNIPRSERLRETLVDTHLFLQECQKKLGHKLPLAAYLLKPVQRITKYQLLLKDLLRFSDTGTCSRELQKALDCMLVVLKCVNDSMHQIAITGFPADLSQQGELLMQDSFQVWTESKKDMRLRLKTQHRHIFLYQKALLFCKQGSKTGHNKSTYQFKNWLQMSQIGLTESVRGDARRFEVWLQGRQEVHTIQATTIEIKNKWVSEIKRVLLNQLEELKGEKIKQYGLNHKPLRQTVSWDVPQSLQSTPHRAMSCDQQETTRIPHINEDILNATGISSSSSEHDNQETNAWSSDYSNSEDEYPNLEDGVIPGNKFISLADYCAMGHSEVSMKEGDVVELLKIGCAGWWFVKVLGNNNEGWAPAAYLEPINRKSSRARAKSQDKLNEN